MSFTLQDNPGMVEATKRFQSLKPQDQIAALPILLEYQAGILKAQAVRDAAVANTKMRKPSISATGYVSVSFGSSARGMYPDEAACLLGTIDAADGDCENLLAFKAACREARPIAIAARPAAREAYRARVAAAKAATTASA